MPRHVLVPLDGSDQATRALEYAVTEFDLERVTVLHVIDPMDAGLSAGGLPGGSEEWYEAQKEHATDLFRDAGETADAAGVPLSTATRVGRPTQEIVTFAEEEDCDHVVMGSHGRSGLDRVLLGSVAEAVVRRSPVPVTVVR